MEVLFLSTITHVLKHVEILDQSLLGTTKMPHDVHFVLNLSLLVCEEGTSVFSQDLQSLFHVNQEWNVTLEPSLILNERVAYPFKRLLMLRQFIIKSAAEMNFQPLTC